jgi:hypothetical protein
MAKTRIVSENTLRDLLEAHASLSAWYYELSRALRAANGVAQTPDDRARTAFVARLAQDFPELSEVVETIGVPRMFVPPPPPMGAATGRVPGAPAEEPATIMEPAQARVRHSDSSPDIDVSAGAPEPPALVEPGSVNYGKGSPSKDGDG